MKASTLKSKIERFHNWILVLIVMLAVVFRIVGIGWGMPHNNLHPDEGIIFNQAYQCALNHSFEVREYYRPNHVTIKLNTLLYFGIQELYFGPQGLDDFELNYNQHFSLFTTASRIMIALFGVGIVAFAYLIALTWGKNQALFTALLFAIFPSFIEHSHYITPDIPLLFFLMVVLWAALCYLKSPSISWLFWMSFFTALATCEKYPGIFGCALIAATVFVTQFKKPLAIVRDGFLAVLFLLLGILAVSPVLIVDFRTVLEIMEGQNAQYHLGADGLNFGQTLVFYSKTAAGHLGLVLTIISIYGIIKSFQKNLKPTIILLVFTIYIIPISTLKVHWERYTLPIYAAGLFFGAAGIFYFVNDFKSFITKNRIVSYIGYFMLFLLPACSLFCGAIAVTASFLAPDSRIISQGEFERLYVTPENTVHDCNTPLDPGGYYGAFASFDAGDPAQYKYGSSPRYVMTSSAQRDLFFTSDPEVYGWIADFYRKLDQEYPLVYVYTVENPSSHFLELQNIWYAARSVYRYLGGAAKGYEIRLYQLVP